MKLFLAILIIFLTGLNYHSNAEDPDFKKITNKRIASTKMILTPPSIAKKKIISAIEEIDRSCCDDSFLEKDRIIEIKKNLQNCVDKKCYSFLLPLYIEKKPPAKLVALRQLNTLDDLLIAHDKHKYNNLINKLDSKKKENIDNEKNINVVKEKLTALEKENINLKKTVDKMLLNYEKKISKLEEENKNISENFNIVFEAHSKNKQKKLEKELK
tara:strand:+ start:378 stop:1019 length:642 start_codon:yes stop_codon:yes gene_type:complete